LDAIKKEKKLAFGRKDIYINESCEGR